MSLLKIRMLGSVYAAIPATWAHKNGNKRQEKFPRKPIPDSTWGPAKCRVVPMRQASQKNARRVVVPPAFQLSARCQTTCFSTIQEDARKKNKRKSEVSRLSVAITKPEAKM